MGGLENPPHTSTSAVPPPAALELQLDDALSAGRDLRLIAREVPHPDVGVLAVRHLQDLLDGRAALRGGVVIVFTLGSVEAVHVRADGCVLGVIGSHTFLLLLLSLA